MNTSVTLFVLACTFPTLATGAVYKCEAANGSITYQQSPCVAGQKESRPAISDAPTLTNKEQFDAAAYAAGMTPEEARRQLDNQGQPQTEPTPARPAQANNELIDPVYRCTKLDGHTFMSKTPCPEQARVYTNPASGAGFNAPVTQDVMERTDACRETRANLKAAMSNPNRTMTSMRAAEDRFSRTGCK